MKRMHRLIGALAVTTCLATLAPHAALAQKSADTLRVTWRDAVPNVDPYYNSLRSGFIVQIHAWDTLIYRDPKTFKIEPLLATEWKWVDEKTIDFTLRPGVTFQNGDKLTADDVVYTVNTVIHDKKVSVPSNYNFYAGAEKIDDMHVRIRLNRVFPAALEYIAMVLPIWPQQYREKVGADEYARHPIGAGPYKITQVDGTTRIVMQRYDGYYAGSPKGKPAIKNIVIHEVPDAATEMAELLGGSADWIWDFDPDQFPNIDAVPTLTALRAETMRVAYMTMDAAGRTGADNPLTKEKVRQAIMYAVDRATMAKQLMQGQSRPLDAPCYPTQLGCDPSVAVKYAYDPAKAKQLLIEAGYPNGFDTSLYSYLLPQWVGAMQNYLRAVGIRASINQLQVGADVQANMDGKTPLNMGSWGSYSINDISAFMPYFFAGGGADYARDPEIEKALEEGGGTTQAEKRIIPYRTAIKLATERAYFMPIFTYVKTYAFSKDLNFQPWTDELPRYYLSSWK
jgi:peptide/nickel transport system substrate-binding protein